MEKTLLKKNTDVNKIYFKAFMAGKMRRALILNNIFVYKKDKFSTNVKYVYNVISIYNYS